MSEVNGKKNAGGPERKSPRRPGKAAGSGGGKSQPNRKRKAASGKKGKPELQPPGFQMGRALKTSLGWMAIVLVAFLLASIFSSEGNLKTASFTELEEYIQADRIASAVITGNTFKGEFREPF